MKTQKTEANKPKTSNRGCLQRIVRQQFMPLLIKVEYGESGQGRNTGSESDGHTDKKEREKYPRIRFVNIPDYITRPLAKEMCRQEMEQCAENNCDCQSTPADYEERLMCGDTTCNRSPKSNHDGQGCGRQRNNLVGKCKKCLVAIRYAFFKFRYIIFVHCNVWVLLPNEKS